MLKVQYADFDHILITHTKVNKGSRYYVCSVVIMSFVHQNGIFIRNLRLVSTKDEQICLAFFDIYTQPFNRY